MSELQALVLGIARKESKHFAGRHLKVPSRSSADVGRALSTLWRQGYFYRMKTHTKMGWFYSNTPRGGFESYEQYKARMKELK